MTSRNKITGTADNDTLDGGYYDDHVEGLGGNDVLLASSGADILDGGQGQDTADYSLYANDSLMSGITANLATGRVDKVTAGGGTTVNIGATGRYIRIYHTNASLTPYLSLTGLKVFAGGSDVAAGLSSDVGADGGNFENDHHNRAALTDGNLGAVYDGLRANGNLAWVRGLSGKAYIELDLGREYAIDDMKVFGRGGDFRPRARTWRYRCQGNDMRPTTLLNGRSTRR